MSYFKILDNIWYDRKKLKILLDDIPKFNWYEFQCNNIRWTVKEHVTRYRLECKNFVPDEFYNDMIDFFKIDLSYDRILFSKTFPPGVPKHIDRTRHTIINIPIDGTFYNSPQSFWKNYDDDFYLDRFYYSLSSKTKEYTPVVFDGQCIHSVENDNDFDRTILSIWFDVDYQEFIKLLDDDKVFNENYNGKFFKIIQ